MGRANKASRPSIAGVLVLDKPVGISSMAAVSVVRGKAGGAKTGHAGTLDPLADGVLVLALGKATKHLKHFMDTDKRYRTVIDLSAFTTTDDLEGERSEVEVVEPPNQQEVNSALQAFVGTIQQRPPAYSAVKVSGRRAYKLARRGERVDLPTRTTTVYGIDLIRYDWPWLEVAVHCGKGTYIRSLARDIGAALRVGGHCHSLRRIAVGPFADTMARRLDEVPEPLLQQHLMPPEAALAMIEGGRGFDGGDEAQADSG